MDFANRPRNQDIARRLEQFFRIADLRCANCGEWHGDHEAFGIHNEAEWESRMDTEIRWILANHRVVLEALPLLQDEWSSCCHSLKDLIRKVA